ncbi:MAG: aldose 1-epimerase [Hyphomonas sp.]
MASGTLVLCENDWTVELDPAFGGQIVRADWRGRSVLAPGEAGRAAAEQHAGCFPLVPFSNRIREARFHFRDRDVILLSPEYAAPHALHGLGWRAAWSAERAGPAEARMQFEHERGAWPWRYRAVQTVQVEADGLHVTLSITNLDAGPMPSGIGLHPYFVRPEGLWVTARTAGHWATAPGETGLPLRREPAPADLGAPGLDHCFHGWDGYAAFGGTNAALITLTASPSLGNIVIYTPPGKPYFCAEPVSHVTDAINMDGLPEPEQMAVLLPGETLSGTMTLSVTPG